MSRRKTSEEQRTCAHCGRVLSNSGRKSETGRYWCATNAACQNAKQKDYYRRTRGIERGDAPSTCSSCGTFLEPRKIRAGDIPGHRWCQRAECQRHRRGTLTRPTVETPEQIFAGEIIVSLQRALVWGRVVCSDCGRTDAVPGYIHRDYDGERCQGTGTTALKVPAAKALWPNEVGAPDGCGPEDYAKMVPTDSRPQEVHPS